MGAGQLERHRRDASGGPGHPRGGDGAGLWLRPRNTARRYPPCGACPFAMPPCYAPLAMPPCMVAIGGERPRQPTRDPERSSFRDPRQACRQLCRGIDAIALIQGFLETLGIGAVVFGAIDGTAAEALEDCPGAGKLAAGDLRFLAPQPRAHQRLRALKVNPLDTDDEDALWQPANHG